MTNDQKLLGSRGCKVLTGTGAHTSLKGYSIIVQEDTVITTFEVDGANALEAYGLSCLESWSLYSSPEQRNHNRYHYEQRKRYHL